MPQTKADRQAAAKKAAATRQRNQVRSDSRTRGTKAAASRQQNRALDSLEDARRAAGAVTGNVGSAARSIGDAAVNAGKSLATKAKIPGR
jgi:hypothetical protein